MIDNELDNLDVDLDLDDQTDNFPSFLRQEATQDQLSDIRISGDSADSELDLIMNDVGDLDLPIMQDSVDEASEIADFPAEPAEEIQKVEEEIFESNHPISSEDLLKAVQIAGVAEVPVHKSQPEPESVSAAAPKETMAPEETATIEPEKQEKEHFAMLRWYSGRIDDKYFEVSNNTPSTEFSGHKDQNMIHINIGSSAYGWNVIFDNGITMNIADLKEFQLRNGRLPYADGTIIHGTKQFKFKFIEKIVACQIPEYFHYGI